MVLPERAFEIDRQGTQVLEAVYVGEPTHYINIKTNGADTVRLTYSEGERMLRWMRGCYAPDETGPGLEKPDPA